MDLRPVALPLSPADSLLIRPYQGTSLDFPPHVHLETELHYIENAKGVVRIVGDSEEEIDDIDEDRKNEQLAIYWCTKEAIFKRMSQNRVDFSEQIEVERFTPRSEGELEARFIHKDGHEEEFEPEYMVFDRHILVWVVG